MIKLIAGAFLLALAGAAAMPSVADESTSTVAPQASGSLTEDATQATAGEDDSIGDLKLNGVGDETAGVNDSEQVETAMDPENGANAGDEEGDD